MEMYTQGCQGARSLKGSIKIGKTRCSGAKGTAQNIRGFLIGEKFQKGQYLRTKTGAMGWTFPTCTPCYGLNYVSSKFICWSPKLQYLGM